MCLKVEHYKVNYAMIYQDSLLEQVWHYSLKLSASLIHLILILLI